MDSLIDGLLSVEVRSSLVSVEDEVLVTIVDNNLGQSLNVFLGQLLRLTRQCFTFEYQLSSRVEQMRLDQVFNIFYKSKRLPILIA